MGGPVYLSRTAFRLGLIVFQLVRSPNAGLFQDPLVTRVVVLKTHSQSHYKPYSR